MLVRRCTCAFLLLWALPAEAQFRVPEPPVPGEDYRVEIGVVFWEPTPELALSTDELDPIGAEVDFVQEFGLEKTRHREYRVTLKPGRKHKLRFQYLPIRYDAEATIQREFVFGGRRFTVGLPATTDIEWKLWRFGYEWDFVSANRGFLGLVAEVKYNDVKAEIASAIGTELAEARAPVPALGVIGRGYLGRHFSITGEFTGFRMPDALSEEYEAEFWDLDLYATLNFGRNFGVEGGYRSIDAEYLVDEDAGRLKLEGLYFGGKLRF